MDIIEKGQFSALDCLGHWYYRAKFALLKSTLLRERKSWVGAQLADVGCGMGVFLTFLARDGIFSQKDMVGVDPGEGASATAIGSEVVIRPDFEEGRQYDVLVLMDVLEHVPEPEKLFASAVEHCRPGGLIFITVPAHQFLWSSHDVFLGHYRRYTVAMLGEMAEACTDVKIIRTHYYYAFILPLVFLIRCLRKSDESSESDMKKANPLVNFLLLGLLKIELLLARFNRLGGVTAVMVVKKI